MEMMSRAVLAYQRIYQRKLNLISFMGIPSTDSIPANLPFGLRRGCSVIQVPNLIEEIVIYTVRRCLFTRQMPLEVGFNQFGGIRVENERLLFPKKSPFRDFREALF